MAENVYCFKAALLPAAPLLLLPQFEENVLTCSEFVCTVILAMLCLHHSVHILYFEAVSSQCFRTGSVVEPS